MEIFFIADVIGIIAFAISGFLVAVRKKLDLLGVFIASFLTALGGGVVRDVALDRTPFSFSELYPSLTVIVTVALAFMLKIPKQKQLENRLLFVIADSIGLIAFSITGALLALEAELNIFGVCMLSFLTAVGGGTLRDVLINEVPFILVSDFYGSVAILLASVMYVTHSFGFLNDLALAIIALIGVSMRLLAYFKKWQLPKIT